MNWWTQMVSPNCYPFVITLLRMSGYNNQDSYNVTFVFSLYLRVLGKWAPDIDSVLYMFSVIYAIIITVYFLYLI